jgi:hypothetical protein
MTKLLVSAVICATLGFSQSTTTQMTGTVIDQQGAAVPEAAIEVVNIANNQTIKAVSNERGEWTIPSVPPATYRVTISKPGFKAEIVENVTVDAGVPQTVNATLQVGKTTDRVEVTAGAAIVQTDNATVSSTIQARQVAELPFATRNSVELMVTQPGVQTPTNPRSSSINGLPKGAINVTIDGMNSQDNLLKSSDGFFSYIYTPVDSVEEMTLTTSAAGVDSTGQGAAQIKFVTRSGSNSFHGGVFWQNRNTFFNANYYFNNQNGLPRDTINLNQAGAHVGGPIWKNKLFFFVNYELYRLPLSSVFTRTVLTPAALNGNYTYPVAGGGTRTVNVLALAAAAGFPSTPDPIVSSTLQQIQGLVSGGNLRSLVPTNNDYNRLTYSYQPKGFDHRNFYTSRLDYTLTQRNILSFIYNYDQYVSIPDILNSVVPVYNGTGTVLGSNVVTGQRSNRFEGTLTLRSQLTSRMTNEFRAGLNGGTVLFFDAVNDNMFAQWRGYNPSFAGGYISGVATTVTPQRRNSPTKDIGETLSWVVGSHQFSFGGNFDQINLFQSSTGSTANSVIPTISFGIASGDPAVTGSTDFFTPNMPGVSSTDRANAESLYAILTGRVSGITQGQSLSADTKTYGMIPAVDRDRIREYGLFAQDTWRLRPTLTLTLGLRYEKQLPFQNLTNTYTTVGIAGLYGISGVGNLFAPGVQTGIVPSYQNVNTVSNAYKIPAIWAPSLGVAWQLPSAGGPLGWLTGKHPGASVLRFGYSIADVREGSNVFLSIWGSNQGLNIDNSVNPTNYPQYFGAPGSVLFRNATLPSRPFPSTPSYPIPACFTCSLNDFNPNLKVGYVQSWNIGYQRELTPNTVIEFRFTGNHGVDLWRQYNLNEVNIVENGFLAEFKNAANNLAIARQANPSSVNFGNQKLPGQVPIPILTTALGGTTSDATIASNLVLGQAGTAAYNIATNVTRLNRLVAAGYPRNFFQVNPDAAAGGAFLLTNDGASYYDAGEAELRKRLSGGLVLQGSYVWSHSITDGASASSVDSAQPTTLRNLRIDRLPSAFDIRHALKINGVYDLPFGPGRHYLSDVHNVVAKRVLEGWQLTGVTRIQSGTPFFLSPSSASSSGGFGTFNQYSDGVVLHNMTASDLQNMIGIYKSTGSDGKGIVTFLPASVITNTEAAFNLAGLTPASVDPNSKYIGPAAAGTVGQKAYFYLPWQRHFDVGITKSMTIREQVKLLISANALNVFNLTNFLPNNGVNSSSFGQITTAYRDLSGTVDPGGRIIEFRARLDF